MKIGVERDRLLEKQMAELVRQRHPLYRLTGRCRGYLARHAPSLVADFDDAVHRARAEEE